mgnify:CR=1 FL=1
MKKIIKILLPDVLLLAGAVTIVVALHGMWPPLAYLRVRCVCRAAGADPVVLRR